VTPISEEAAAEQELVREFEREFLAVDADLPG